MNDIFLYDKNTITYQELIDYVNLKKLEVNYSKLELFVLEFVKNILGESVLDLDDLIYKIKYNNKKIILKSSGTTGEPKSVIHTIESISKNIIIDVKYMNVCWGLTYPEGKMAFYQVLLQSLFNKSKIINLYGYTFDQISNRIIDNCITHISATPTFYRMLLSSKIHYNNVKQITLGGEGSTKQFIDNLRGYFPNSKIKNIYASTETASIFASDNDVFKFPVKYKDKVKVIDNKLFIHKDLIGLIENGDPSSEWYDTKDLVEFISDNEFRLIGRENNQINVSGFKINPIKIESVINSLPYVINSVVYSKKNSVVGSILCCDIVLNEVLNKKNIKLDLTKLIDKYEIPTIINIVDTIKINESMKISRT
jgi:acyl-coenzyme A synthetase/AMP-(fatty) acid ligase